MAAMSSLICWWTAASLSLSCGLLLLVYYLVGSLVKEDGEALAAIRGCGDVERMGLVEQPTLVVSK